jgi:hypothetical protein
MKTFQNFCKDANIQEFWNPFAPKVAAPSKPQPVLAYKNYQQGFGKGKDWKPGKWSPEQEKRYGYRPVTASSYSKADTPGSLTASGHKFDDKQRLVAVPYASKTSTKPSIPFGTQLQLTKAPGTSAPVATTSVQDTGNFGSAGDYNKQTDLDLAHQTAADVSGNKNITSQEFGKQKLYVRTVSPSMAKTIPTTQSKGLMYGRY